MAHRRTIRRMCAVPTAIVVMAALAACGGDDDDTASTEGGGGEGGDGPVSIEVANTSPTQPGFVPSKYGVITHGEELGLDMSLENFTTFDSHAVATQTVLSGQADVVAGSLVSHMLLIEQGQDFKAFCPYISQDDFVIVGANGVDDVKDLFDPNVRVALDSPGGAGDIILNAMLQALGEERTAADIPGIQILESSGLRTTAFASGDVDATVIHDYQYFEAAEQTTDPAILATLYDEVPGFVKEAHAAPTAWLDDNVEVAASYCAGVLLGMRELSADYDTFVQAVTDYADVEEMPDDETLRTLHETAVANDFWPGEDGGLNEENIAFMSDVAVNSGLLSEGLTFDDVVDTRVLDRALEIVEEQS